MSDVCGRRRLAKLAFVTGASGNLRGFLEEPVHTNYNYRLTDPFAFHAAFLEERLRMQADQSSEEDDQAAKFEEEKAKKLKTELSGFLSDLGVSSQLADLLENLKKSLSGKMTEFTEAWLKIEREEQKRRIVERVEKGSVIKDGLEMPPKPDQQQQTMEEQQQQRVDNLVKRILGFEDAPKQAGLDKGGSTLLYTDAGAVKSVVFNIGNQIQSEVDKGESFDPIRGKTLMHKIMAAAIHTTVDVTVTRRVETKFDGTGVVTMQKKPEATYQGKKCFLADVFSDDEYRRRENNVVIEWLRAIRDSEGKIIAGLRGSEETVNNNELFLALCPNLYGYTPLVEASAEGETSKHGLTITAKKFFPNAFMHGIDLQVKLDTPWTFQVGGKGDFIFRFDLSKIKTQGDKIVEDFKEKIKDANNIKAMNELGKALDDKLKGHELLKGLIEVQDAQVLPSMPDESNLSSADATKWNSLQDTVQEFVKNRVMVKPQKATEVKDSVEFFKQLSGPSASGQSSSIEVFIGNLLSHPKFTEKVVEAPKPVEGSP